MITPLNPGAPAPDRRPLNLVRQRLRWRVSGLSILGLLFLLTMPAVVRAQFDFATNDGAVTIIRYTGSGGDVIIPDTINGLPVRSIASFAFFNSTRVTTVAIPRSVIEIGNSAFDYTADLTDVAVDALNPAFSSVNGVLFDKEQITLILYPAGKSGSYTIPESVTRIGDSAFLYCRGLTNVSLGSNVSDLGYYAFTFCQSLSEISVSELNPFFSSLQGVLFDKGRTTLLRYPARRAGSYTIPDSVTKVNYSALRFCYSLTNLTIGDSVVELPSDAFDSCPKLTGIAVEAVNPAFSSLDGVLHDRNQTVVIRCPLVKGGPFIITNSVSEIGNGAFSQCVGLSSITIGSGVARIGDSAFDNCAGLTSVTIPNSVISVGKSAFSGCSSLTNLTIGERVAEIGDSAFLYCNKVADLRILDSVVHIGTKALFGCGALTNLTLGHGITNIGDSVFGYCNNLSTVTIPDTVTSIGNLAFSGCSSLTNLTLGNSITSIGHSAFDGCIKLTNLTIPGRVSYIGNLAFAYCSSLTAVYFKGNAPSNDSSLFYNANNATVYYLPGTMGWGPTFSGRPASPWVLANPLILSMGAGFGVRTNAFGFIISWATNRSIVIEAATNMMNGTWLPVSTNVLNNGSSYFSDPDWTNSPVRFYRVGSP